jgi:hypothetical protein
MTSPSCSSTVVRRSHARAFLVIGLAFLWLRNAPLALFLPFWSHGDEIAHLDYTLKIGRGHLPRSDEYIEPAVYRLHRARFDARYFSRHRKMKLETPADLGLAAYSYEAPQPPLAYLLMAAVRLPMKAAGLSLIAQVKGLRLAGLLAMSAGLLFLYFGLRRRQDLRLYWYAPLLLIPLLTQDMYVSINTDVFAFLAGCAVFWAVFRLFERPAAASRWAALALMVALAMWTKATCAFFFALWPVLAVVLGRTAPGRQERRRIAALAVVFFLTAAALAAPWYALNSLRASYVFGFQFEKQNGLSYKRFVPPPLSWKSATEFKNAFGFTLIRGEMLWHGVYLGSLPQPWNKIVFEVVLWILLAAGLAAVFLPASMTAQTAAGPAFVLAAAAFGWMVGLFILHFGYGGIPFYHARYAFAALYPLLFILAAGIRRLIPKDWPAVMLPALALLAFNAVYTIRLVANVLVPGD